MEYTAKNCFRIGVLMSFASSVLMALLFNVFIYGTPATGGGQNTGTLGTAQTGIRFTKNTLNGNGVFDFVLHYPNRDVPFTLATQFVPDIGFDGTATETFYYVVPGTYSITEVGPSAPWEKISDTCSSITVVQGQITSCAIANKDVAPRLLIIKRCDPSWNGSEFAINAQGPTDSRRDDMRCGQGYRFSLEPGTYTVSETSVNGADLDDYTTTYGGDCNALGQVTLESGEQKQCIVNNIHKSKASLTVRKVCDPIDDDGEFVIHYYHGDRFMGGVTIKCGENHSHTVVPGTWRILERPYETTDTTLDDYIVTYGGNCNVQGQVTLAADDNKTCTITNTKKLNLLTPLDASRQ